MMKLAHLLFESHYLNSLMTLITSFASHFLIGAWVRAMCAQKNTMPFVFAIQDNFRSYFSNFSALENL